jgi:hypothetical protein
VSDGGLISQLINLLLVALELRKVYESDKPNVFLTAVTFSHLLLLAWNFRAVLRFLLRVGFYAAIPVGVGAVMWLFGEITPD